MVNHVNLLPEEQAFLSLALVAYVAGYRSLKAIKICVICHDQFTVAAAPGQVRRHISKQKSTHYLLLVNHAANVSTSPTMGPVVLGSLNA